MRSRVISSHSISGPKSDSSASPSALPWTGFPVHFPSKACRQQAIKVLGRQDNSLGREIPILGPPVHTTVFCRACSGLNDQVMRRDACVSAFPRADRASHCLNFHRIQHITNLRRTNAKNVENSCEFFNSVKVPVGKIQPAVIRYRSIRGNAISHRPARKNRCMVQSSGLSMARKKRG